MLSVLLHFTVRVHVHSLTQLEKFHSITSVCFRWRPPRYFQCYSPEKFQKLRRKWHILVEGEDIPPPIRTFKVNLY